VLAAVFGGVAFGLAETLRRPAGQVLLAARILGELEQADAVASVERVGGRSLRARCGPLGSEASLITLSDGARLLVRSERVRILRRGLLRGDTLAATVDLAGCPRLLGALLGRRLVHAFTEGRLVRLRLGERDARPAYRLWLTVRPPWLVLEVSRGTLVPVAVRFLSRRLVGVAAIRSIAPSAGGPRRRPRRASFAGLKS